MIKEELNFRIELVNPVNEQENDKFARDFVHSFGLKTHSGTWSCIALDSPAIHDFTCKSKELVTQNIAKFNGLCSLCQYIEEDEQTNIEWYELSSSKDMSIVDYGGIITCRADKMSPNVHVAIGWSYNVYVSEKFKEVAENNHLRGLEFIWLKDVGKFQAPQWYLPVILNPLGRGIDHPWFDRNTLRGSGSAQPIDPKFFCGTSHFKANQIKKNIVIDKQYREIINLFEPEVLTIISFKSFSRNYIPKTDFAYIWHYEDEERESNGLLYKQRGLCISKKAKEILVQNKLISESQLSPIQIIEKADDIEILDGCENYPSPFYSYTHIGLEELRKKLNNEWNKHIKKIKPIKKINLNQALRLLMDSKKHRPEDFEKRLSENELKGSIFQVPEYWIEILKKSNGGLLNNECTLVPFKEINEFHREKQAYCEDVYEDYPVNLIHVAFSIDGDWYSLINTSNSLQDSKVLRISHETCQPITEWDTIPDFLYEMLLDCYE